MKASQAAIDNLGLNILNRGFIKANDILELRNAIQNELSRRNLTVPVSILDLLTATPAAGIRVLNRHLQQIYESAIVSGSQNWTSRAEAGRIITRDDIDECIYYLKALMAQTLPNEANRAIMKNGYMSSSGAVNHMVVGSGTYGTFLEVYAHNSYGNAESSIITDRLIDLTNVQIIRFKHIGWGDNSTNSRAMFGIHTTPNRPSTSFHTALVANGIGTNLQTNDLNVGFVSGSFYITVHVITQNYVQKAVKLIEISTDNGNIIWSANQDRPYSP